MAWLAQRQSVIAANIANADTPGYRARAVAGFDAAMGEAAGQGLTLTHAAHMPLSPGSALADFSRERQPWDQSHSGNTVSIERELIEAGQSVRMMNVDASLTRSFHRMMMMSLKV